MHGTLTCPRCGATGIALGAAACPACQVAFAQPVIAPVLAHAGGPPDAMHAGPAVMARPTPAYYTTAATAPAAESVVYGTLGQRFVAGLLDVIIVSLPFVMVSPSDAFWSEEFTTLDYVSIVVGWLYYAMMQASSWQATLGMRVMRLRVVEESTYEQISFLRATGRHFASYVSVFILLIGYLMIAFTQRRQALHDLMAGTVVVRDAQRR